MIKSKHVLIVCGNEHRFLLDEGLLARACGENPERYLNIPCRDPNCTKRTIGAALFVGDRQVLAVGRLFHPSSHDEAEKERIVREFMESLQEGDT